MFIEVSGMVGPRGGNRGGVKTPAGEVLNKYSGRLPEGWLAASDMAPDAEYSHVFQKSWDNIDCPLNHPEFSDETSFTQDSMKLYTMALSSLNCSDFTPQVHAETKDSHVRIAFDVAVSRLLPIPDGVDSWRAGVARLQDQVPPRLAATGTMLSLSRDEVHIHFASWPHNDYV
jgi:hypothetical protein